MNINCRDWLEQVIYKIINAIVRGMIKIGITPNFITTTGLILNIVAAGIFIYAGLVTDSEEDLSLVGWTGGLILFAGLFDMMDGDRKSTRLNSSHSHASRMPSSA